MDRMPRDLIGPDEYAARVTALRALLRQGGHDAALVWARGGGSVDRYADLRYLTGYYPVFPTIRDLEGVWSDRGLAAALVTADEVLLFADEVGVDEAASGVTTWIGRHGSGDRTLVGDVVAALGERAGVRSLLLVATDAMSGKQARALAAEPAFGALAVADDNGIVEGLRLRKSAAEIALLREAASIAEEALEAGFAAIRPGAREADVVAAMAEVVSRREAVLANAFVYTFQSTGGSEDNRLPIHSGRVFAEGDLFTVDLSGTYAGYFFDLARSVVVGGAPTADQTASYELARATVDAVIDAFRPGVVLGDAARAGSDLLRAAGVDPERAEFTARGHGLGLGFEAPWIRDDSTLVLEAGMVVSVEQFCFVGDTGATFERNLVITEDGAEDLVAVRDFWSS